MFRLRSIFRYLSTPSRLMAIGALSLLLAFLPPVLGNLMILATGSGESRSVRETGTITCPDVLHWSDWQNGTGTVVRSHLYEQIDKSAEIISYRIGTDRKFFAVLTFYQARYRLPDETTIVAHASGPFPLVSVDTSRSLPCSAIFCAIAVACFVAVGRGPSTIPIVRITDSDNIKFQPLTRV